jgi:SulP family sulfate permease
MLRINGSIFFGAVEHVEDALHRVDQENKQQLRLLVAASGINFVDISGAELLSREAARRERMGGGLYFWFVKDAVHGFLKEGGYLKGIGEDHIFPQHADAIAILYPKLDSEICRTCTARIFPQCHVALPNGEPRVPEDDSSPPSAESSSPPLR